MSDGERRIFDLLNDRLDPSTLVVQDTSGGCGAFYQLQISSKAFKGLTMIKQHRLVQDILKEEIKQLHGLQIQTSVADEN